MSLTGGNMDRKRTIKTVSAVCFVMVCGVMYLVLCSPFGKKEEIVFEKRPDVLQAEAETKDGELSPDMPEKPEEDDGENRGESGTKDEISENVLYVHVCGAVMEEGVYALPAGSRVTDGIKVAGGFREGADTTFHNLAALLADGQKIYVPTLEETESLSLPERTEGTESGLSEVTGVYGSTVGTKVNLNTAGLAELMTLSGIGEAKAESILKYREKVGRFQNIEELKNVSGIGDAMFERVREEIVAE